MGGAGLGGAGAAGRWPVTAVGGRDLTVAVRGRCSWWYCPMFGVAGGEENNGTCVEKEGGAIRLVKLFQYDYNIAIYQQSGKLSRGDHIAVGLESHVDQT
eukprot:g35911.t1